MLFVVCFSDEEYALESGNQMLEEEDYLESMLENEIEFDGAFDQFMI